MSEKDQKVEVILGFSVEGVRSAAKNASDINEVVLDVACVDPNKLHIGSEIFGLKVVPVKDDVKKSKPCTLCTVGVIRTNVDTLSGVVTPNCITINGNIDIPKELGRNNLLKDIYFETMEEARQVAMVFLEEEYNKAEEAVEATKKVRDFLKEQFEAGRV